MEELRAQTEYQPANDPLGFPQITAQEIVNRFLDYSFTAEGRYFTGHAFMPDRIQAILRESDPLPIRYLPSNPSINHPSDWEDSAVLDCFPFSLPIAFLLISVIVYVSMRIDRPLVTNGMPAVAVITKCTPHVRGGITVKYKFRAEDGSEMKGSSGYDSLQEIGASICILYLPWNPRRNQTYISLCYRVVQ